MNHEWMNEWPFNSIHTDFCEHTEKELHWSVLLYSGNPLNVCVCLTTAQITDGDRTTPNPETRE